MEKVRVGSDPQAAVRQPLLHGLGRIAVELRLGREGEDVPRRVAHLVAAMREIQDDGLGHHHGRVLVGAERDPLLEALDPGHRLVGVFVAKLELPDDRVLVVGIDQRAGTADEIGEG
jgi:hypothetical protein